MSLAWLTAVPPSSQASVVYDHDGNPTTTAIAVPLNAPQVAAVQFVPTTGYTGNANPVTFTVTDNDGAVSVPAIVTMTPIRSVIYPTPSVNSQTTTDTTPVITGSVSSILTSDQTLSVSIKCLS